MKQLAVECEGHEWSGGMKISKSFDAELSLWSSLDKNLKINGLFSGFCLNWDFLLLHFKFNLVFQQQIKSETIECKRFLIAPQKLPI